VAALSPPRDGERRRASPRRIDGQSCRTQQPACVPKKTKAFLHITPYPLEISLEFLKQG
jgi:hypothetical protein